MQELYNLIKTPSDLLKFMQEHFTYGYIDKHNNSHLEFDQSWIDDYQLQIKEDMLNSKVGCCFDAAEFERSWFLLHGYDIKTIFEMVKLDYVNNYSMHTFLLYFKEDKYYYFEWADGSNAGIYEFATLDAALEYSYDLYLKFLKNQNITLEETKKIIRTMYDEPRKRYGAVSYLKFVQSGYQIKR